MDDPARLLEFAARARVPDGFGWLDGDGVPVPEHGAPLWITARMTHCFALGHLLGHPGSAELCDHGLASLPRAGGDDAYDHSFVILAAAGARVAERPGAVTLLQTALDVAERRFWREEEGVVADDEPYRGANANMHMVEAFLATGEPRWADRARRIAERLIDEHARAHDWRVPEHFDAHWTPLPDYNADAPAHPFRPFGHTPGHGFEWARLLLHLEAALPDPPGWLRPAAHALFDRAWDDGWQEPEGGFVYTTDAAGRAVVAHRFHWVCAEAIATATVLGDAERTRTAWAFAERHFVDRERGGWRAELDERNRPVAATWDGKPDTYHALQATLVGRLPLTPGFALSARRRASSRTSGSGA